MVACAGRAAQRGVRGAPFTLGKRNALLVIVSPKNDPNAFLVIQNNAFSVIVFENRHLRRISIGTNVVTREVFGKIIVCIEWPRML